MDVNESKEVLKPPLGQSEKHNAGISRKLRTREVTSRYMSGVTSPSRSTPQRSPSPSFSRTGPMLGTPVIKRSQSAERIKRSQSAERRRPSTPSPSQTATLSTPSRPSTPSSPSRTTTLSNPSRPSTPSSPSRTTTLSTSSRPFTPFSSRSTISFQNSAMEMQNSSKRSVNERIPEGLWPSMRSMSLSFQSDTSSLPVMKKDRPVSDQALKPSLNVAHVQAETPARKMTPERRRTPLRGRNASDQVENSKPRDHSHMKLVDQHRWPSRTGGKLSVSSLTRSVDLTDRLPRNVTLPLPARGASPIRKAGKQRPDGEVSQRTSNHRIDRVDSGSLLNDDKPLRSRGDHKLVTSRSLESASSISRPSRTLSSPLPSSCRPSSPTKASVSASTSRGMLSPSRSRPPSSSANLLIGRSGTSTSVLSYSDVRKGKKANHTEDVHQLRLLYNRFLQWRFVNARAETTLVNQAIKAEDILCSTWNSTSRLCDSVCLMRISLQQWKQVRQLTSIVEEQMTYLDDWVLMDRDHCHSLAGAAEALESCTLRLPVTGGARANVHNVKDAVSSAVDVMQAMGSSICFLQSNVEKVKSLITELANVTAQEKAMLAECSNLLTSLAMMQVEESGLRAHMIQLN